jgi:hypothetical protein
MDRPELEPGAAATVTYVVRESELERLEASAASRTGGAR